MEQQQIRVTAAVLAVVALIGAMVTFVVVRGDDEVATGGGSSTTTRVSTTTTSSPPVSSTAETSTTAAPQSSTTAGVSPAEAATAVWPWVGSSQRFGDPVAAATSFATELVGFSAPLVSDFLQGDSRSGEVEVRPRPDGPVTTVFVRQLGADDSWWVLGSATTDVEVDDPSALATIDEPMRLVGRARAFEGAVEVVLRADGVESPVATGFVTGRGDGVMGAFDSELAYAPPTAERGAVMFITRSAEDGQVWQAGVVRISFPSR